MKTKNRWHRNHARFCDKRFGGVRFGFVRLARERSAVAMRNYLAGFALVALGAAPAAAAAIVMPSCGNPPGAPYAVGSTHPETIDVKGNKCVSTPGTPLSLSVSTNDTGDGLWFITIPSVPGKYIST